MMDYQGCNWICSWSFIHFTLEILISLNSPWEACGPNGHGVVGPRQCLLVLELETCCQKFPNVSYTLPQSQYHLCFIGNIDERIKTNAVLIGNTSLEKHEGVFQIQGFPLVPCVSVLASGSSWNCSSCKVPLFHLMLWSFNLSQGHVLLRNIVHNPGRKF